jgi:hypothetical protein
MVPTSRGHANGWQQHGTVATGRAAMPGLGGSGTFRVLGPIGTVVRRTVLAELPVPQGLPQIANTSPTSAHDREVHCPLPPSMPPT